MTRTGVYPGTFDPITRGHMDIIRRGAKLVDRLVIGVTTNPSKSPMFSIDERMEMVKRETTGIDGDANGSAGAALERQLDRALAGGRAARAWRRGAVAHWLA